MKIWDSLQHEHISNTMMVGIKMASKGSGTIRRRGLVGLVGVSRRGLVGGRVSLWRQALRCHICSSHAQCLRSLPVEM